MKGTAPSAFRYIGKPHRTKEDPRFVTGRGRYVADIALPGLRACSALPRLSPCSA